jgi:hypothetical protein
MRIRIRNPITLRGSSSSGSGVGNNEDGEKQPDSQTPLSVEQRNALEFYESQKAFWKTYVRIELHSIDILVKHVSTPHLVLHFRVHSCLPTEFLLTRVTKGEGTVGGQYNLPTIEGSIDKKVGPCGDKDFELRLDIHGTKLPEVLQSPAWANQTLQWFVKAEWYAHIYGGEQLVKSKANDLSYSAIPNVQ